MGLGPLAGPIAPGRRPSASERREQGPDRGGVTM